MSALFGNDRTMIDQVRAAADASGELVWELPLHRPYRKEIDSLTADLMNCAPVGKPDAIIASLFLAHFVGDVPWAHLDIAGPMNAESDSGWKSKGAIGFGTRTLIDFACTFAPA